MEIANSLHTPFAFRDAYTNAARFVRASITLSLPNFVIKNILDLEIHLKFG